jgi:hypothetical protein
MDFTASQQVLLVVYAVTWAGALPTLSRLRVLAINDLFRRSALKPWLKRLARFLVGVLLGNVAPVALLLVLLTRLPTPPNSWGIAVAALAGLSPEAFPRLLHAAVISDETWKFFFDEQEKDTVLEQWDRPTGSSYRTSNRWFASLLAGLTVLALTLGLAWWLGWALT